VGVAGVRLAGAVERAERRPRLAGFDGIRGRRTDLVRVRAPVDARVVDGRARDGLGGDPLHGAGDEALAREAVRERVRGLELIAEVPVGYEAEAPGEEPLPLGVEDVVHPEVVLGDVGLAGGDRTCDVLLYLGRDALGKAGREPGLGPLVARPPRAVPQALGERGHGEVEEHGEADLLGEQVLAQVRIRVVGREQLVDGSYGPEVEVGHAPELAGDFVQVAIDLLEGAFEPREESVQFRPTRDEVAARDLGEGAGIAILRPPQARGLLEAAGEALALRFAVAGGQLVLDRLQVEARRGRL
jgi:hypothetical protein